LAKYAGWALGFTILNVFLVGFGEVTLTAFAIGNRVSSLVLMPTTGIGSALSTVVGQNIGADNVARAKEAVKRSVVISTVILSAGGALMYPFSERLISAFTMNAEVIYHGTNYLKLIIVAVPLMGFFQILNGTFQGSGHTVYSMILMMGRLWGLRIPMIVALSHTPSFGPNSVWYAMIASNFIICCVGWGIYFTGRWQRKVIKDIPSVQEL
jgi:Na+-driven multidrug efflux pump